METSFINMIFPYKRITSVFSEVSAVSQNNPYVQEVFYGGLFCHSSSCFNSDIFNSLCVCVLRENDFEVFSTELKKGYKRILLCRTFGKLDLAI